MLSVNFLGYRYDIEDMSIRTLMLYLYVVLPEMAPSSFSNIPNLGLTGMGFFIILFYDELPYWQWHAILNLVDLL